jgi:NAD(P)-dependent dehydrogenase (short-subunit alcohol dehydrogenase family)
MSNEFAGRVVVVTGASKGIGFACAEAFVRAGAKVALVSRSRENLDGGARQIATLREPARRDRRRLAQRRRRGANGR